MIDRNHPKVSVIIPFYNSIYYVLKAIQYLKNQTFKDFEVILVDDGSTDPDKYKVNDAITCDSRFSLKVQPHLGAGVARNFGFTFVKGNYVIFLDADDTYEEKLLEKLFLTASKRHSEIVLCNAKVENATWSVLHVSDFRDAECETKSLKNSIFQITAPAPWNKLIRTSLIKNYNLKFLPLQNANDLTFTYSALALAEKISWVDEPLILYSQSNPNSIQNSKDKNPENIILALEGLLNNLEKYRKFEDFKESFVKLVASHIVLNIQTFKETKSRLKLLNNFFGSELYQRLFKLQKLPSCCGTFAKDIELLRSSFYKPYSVSSNRKKDDGEARASRFAIIIPFYNDQNFINIPIESLLKQTFLDFQVFLINDGSTDKSKENALKLIRNDKRFEVIDQPNQGLSVARNLGMSLAFSDYIIFLDSDDGLIPQALEKLNSYIEEESPDVIFFEAKAINYFNSNFDFSKDRCKKLNNYYTRRGSYPGILTGPQVMEEASRRGEFIPSACLSVCKLSFLKRKSINFIPKLIHEDNPYTFEILLKAKSVLILKDKIYLRTVRPESITTKEKSIRNIWGYYSSFLKTQELLHDILLVQSLSEEQVYAFQVISHNFLKAAQNLWKVNKDHDLFLLFLPKGERYSFERFMDCGSSMSCDLIPSTIELRCIKWKRRLILNFKFVVRRLIKKIFPNKGKH